jgi:acyl-CoA synthetase (NDP forming)
MSGRVGALERLLKPSSIAVIGASADPGRTSGRPIAYLRRHGYAGTVFAVNPRLDSIDGAPCYPSVAALPSTPDAAIVLLGAERAIDADRDLAARGTAAAVVIAGGYAEHGGDGVRRQEALKSAAGSMRLLGPNTIGVVNLSDRVMLTATGALESGAPVAGAIAVVSQSGGILGSLLSRAGARRIGFSKLVATGNEADLEISDFIEYLAGDDATEVISLYVETLRDPDRFRAAALLARQAGKRIVAYKVGRSELGASAAASHTGALTGTDRMYDALFRQVGVLRVDRYSELLDVASAAASARTLRGNRIAVLTSTGGAAALVADSCGAAGFEAPVLDAATAARLAAVLSADAASLRRNPVDVTLAGARPELLRDALGVLLEAAEIDAVVAIVGSSALAAPRQTAHALADGLGRGTKPLLAYVSPHAPEIVGLLNEAGIPAFVEPESCAVALAAMRSFAAVLPPAAAPPVEVAREAAARARQMSGPLNELEARQLFGAIGIAGVDEVFAATPSQAEQRAHGLGTRVVVKVLCRELVHKSEAGAVRVDVPIADVARVCEDMRAAVAAAAPVRQEGFLVQELVVGGTEMIVGFRRDPQLGGAVLVGLGGIATELFNDTAMRLLPLGRADVEAMLGELKCHALLTGARGRLPVDLPALVDAILSFAAMATSLGAHLREAEINPLFVLPQGRGVRAADGVVLLS